LNTDVLGQPSGHFGEFHHRSVFSSGEVTEHTWELIRAFVTRVERQDIRMRFGAQINLRDEPTLRRFFGITGAGEISWVLDREGSIAGISHRVRSSRSDAEIALLVRSDLKRRGAGTRMLQELIATSCREKLTTLHAVVLRENKDVIRLAAKAGFIPKGGGGLSMKLELPLTGERCTCRGKALKTLVTNATP